MIGASPSTGSQEPTQDQVTRIDFVLRTHEVCGYALVVSLTAIMLAGEQRSERLSIFWQALDAFEQGAFDSAIRCAREAAAPILGAAAARGSVEDAESVHARLHRLLARPPGTA